jgi:phosphoribosylformylglycinamidine cyclo-ligase
MSTYRDAGVDLAAAERHVDRIGPLVTASWGPNVVGGFGGFAAGVELPDGYRRPVMMLSTDGVGTKLDIARRSGLWDGVGYDLVAMCCDDLAVVGAEPIAFVDYLAVGALAGDRDARIVASIARACAEAGAALVGGETAEHPGVMDHDAVDLAGAALGVVERGREITGETIRPGDVVLGLPSPNLRSNGFSLVRKVLDGVDLDARFPGEEATVAEVLLRPSVLYGRAALAASRTGLVKGMAHITGGGLPGNLIRPLPEGCRVTLDRAAWTVPDVFRVIQHTGGISDESMAETFNLGIGFCLVVDGGSVDTVTEAMVAEGLSATVVGRVTEGRRSVALA